ncbi:MAG: fibronectin type III domain-containing protein, partial [Bacteroidales bacterium]|nr:fibronectin type III domain-containing protein [Bacteroidales bacterium]
LYIKIGNSWQSSYIWNGNDFWDTGSMAETDYQTVTVTLPKNVTAVRFRGSQYTLDWQWDKYGGSKRYIKNVRVYMGAEAIATPAELDYEVYIGQKNTDDNTKTFNLKYSNKVTDGAKFDIDNKKFSGTFPTINSCTIGNEKDIPVSFYTEELNSNGEQGSLTIVTGDVASVSLNATVKALPAPKDLEANATGKSSVTLTWEENPGDDNKALGLASGYYVRYKKSSAESYGDPVFVARKTEDTNYSHTVPSLEDGTEYNFKVTTIYTDSKSNKIENEYAEITTSTYSTVTVSKNGGIFSVTPFYYITCSNGGSWNVNEKSFAKGATAVITPVQTLECDKYKDANVNEGDPVTGETISFEVNTPSTVKLNYEFGLSTPVINSITVNGKSSVTLSWYNVSCSSSYTLFIYKSGEKRTIEGVSTPYTVTELEEGTDYEFALQAIRNDGETEYTSAESSHIPATTYSTLKVETDGEYAEQIEFTLAGEEGKWNSTEKSFAKDSKATITASLKEGVTCAIFDKILVGETEYTENPAEITMTAPATATISYKFAGLEKPTVVVSENNSKDKISISWNSVDCAESYTVYNGDEEVATGIITATEYKFENLTPATEYQFNVKAVNGDKSAESDAVNATTYTTSMNVEVEGIFGSDQVVYSITSTAMNTDEKSYAIGSTATVGVTTLPASCVVDKIKANGVDISTTATFTVAAENNVKITYRYTGTGVAEVIGGQIYETLNAAVDAVQDGGTINLLGDVPTQDLSVSGKHVEFNGNRHQISNMYIKSDGSVDLIGDVVVVNDFGLEISTKSSGQFTQTNAEIIVNGQAYIDKALDPSGVGNERCWYSVAVPFEVSYTDGIYAYINGDWKKVTFNKDFILKEYDGALRAASTTKLQGWVLPTTENIVPGKFYLMGLGYNGPNIFRFYKATGKDLITAENSIAINKYESSNDMNAGWNGIGNLKLFNVGIESAASGFAQVLHNGKFMTVELSSSKFAVTTPMFIQSSINTTADFSRKTNGTLRSVAASSGIYNLRIRKENASDYSDQMFASASYETIGQYTIGRDLAKMEVSTGYPQIYTRAFNANLSVHEAQYNEKGVAGMPLYMYAPAAGNYTLNLGKEVYDGTSLLLIKDGVEIHNFNVDGAYTLYLAKGTNSSYSLQISSGEGGDIPTPVADATSNNKVHVYVSNGVLVIENLASGENYTVGNLIRTLHYGTSSGSKITIPLATKGVYWVKAGTTSVKVLNK